MILPRGPKCIVTPLHIFLTLLEVLSSKFTFSIHPNVHAVQTTVDVSELRAQFEEQTQIRFVRRARPYYNVHCAVISNNGHRRVIPSATCRAVDGDKDA